MINKLIKVSFLLMLLGAALLMNMQNKGYAADFIPFWSPYSKDYQLFEGVMIAPSRETGYHAYSIVNKNKEAIDVSKELKLTLKKEGFSDHQLQEMLSLYEISWKEDFNKVTTEYKWVSIEDFLNQFNTKETKKINPDEEYKLQFNIKLSEKAGNEYQAAKLLAQLSLNSKTEIGETVVEDGDGNQLPKTSTNTSNMMFIGIILLLLGGSIITSRVIYLLVKKRGISNDL